MAPEELLPEIWSKLEATLAARIFNTDVCGLDEHGLKRLNHHASSKYLELYALMQAGKGDELRKFSVLGRMEEYPFLYIRTKLPTGQKVSFWHPDTLSIREAIKTQHPDLDLEDLPLSEPDDLHPDYLAALEHLQDLADEDMEASGLLAEETPASSPVAAPPAHFV